MKTSLIVGIVLILLGVVSLAYQGITFTSKEKIVDIGPIEASKETKNRIPLPPIFGAVALVGGIALVVTAKK